MPELPPLPPLASRIRLTAPWDEFATLYHGTSGSNAVAVLDRGFLPGDVWFSTSFEDALSYIDPDPDPAIIQIRIEATQITRLGATLHRKEDGVMQVRFPKFPKGVARSIRIFRRTHMRNIW